MAAGDSPFGEDYVAYGHVQLSDAEPGYALDAVGDPAPHLIHGLQDVPAVLDAHREVYGGLDLADLDGDAARLALRTGYVAEDPAGRPGGAAAHMDALHLLRSPADYRGDDRVADGGAAALAHERAFVSLLAHLFILLR